MTETAKTVLFVGAAALSLMIAFAMGPADITENLDDLVGSRLNQFDVDVAKRLKIVKFDKDTASTREFEVAENDGLWTIPSKQGYPADAAEQMGEAATCVIDREVLRVAAKSAADHKSLGVVDPSSKVDSKGEGVGTRVTITDSNDTKLADMIIGKPVKDADGQYYVRNTDQDVVYVVNLEPDKLSTKFDDWIEDDLLQLSPLDIQRLYLEDYSAEMQIVMTNRGIEPRVALDQRGKMELTYDSTDSKWQAKKLEKFDMESKQFVEDPLAEDEEINEDTMRELRNGLDDLLLVDVERKPEGLSSDLKASSDFLTNQEALESLQEKGFIPVGRNDQGEAEILSSEGETICTLKSGVEYVLRFGNLTADGESSTEGKSDAEDAEGSDSEEEDADAGFNRYLFVMARFNESILEKPELAEVPELPEGAEAAAAEEETDSEAETASESTESEPAEEAPTENTAAEETEEQEEEEEVAEDSGEEATAESADASATEEAAAEPAEEQSEEDALADLMAERESIEKENQRKLDEYADKVEEGKQRVAELNERFGDWYYVISNDVYEKIHLSRKDIVKKKEGEDAEEESATDSAPAGLPGLPNLPINPAN